MNNIQTLLYWKSSILVIPNIELIFFLMIWFDIENGIGSLTNNLNNA